MKQDAFTVILQFQKHSVTATLLQISIHLQQMGKIGPFGKSRKVFLAHQKWAERFFRMQKNFFSNKNAMKVMKVQQKATENPREKSF
jgi:hypothetical protein